MTVMWAIKSPWNDEVDWGVSRTRSGTIKQFVGPLPYQDIAYVQKEWRSFYRIGWRCRKVRVEFID